MNILVIGSGGREHALVWKLRQSPLVDELYCAPGNAGIAREATCINIPIADIDSLCSFAHEKNIGLTVVGPEAPLVAGLVDHFTAEGMPIFGPSADAARLEGSKAFAKRIIARAGVPTAHYHEFTDFNNAKRYIENIEPPVVIKADGLAAGKGVTVAQDRNSAIEAARQSLEQRVFGAAGARILVEEYLEGEEASILALSDGENILVLPTSQDHKRIGDNDTGPNTGGMGAYSPAPVVTAELADAIERKILLPIIRTMKEERVPYRGVLYAGLMITNEGPKVIEFNVRFGDPETQAVLPRLKSDIVPLLEACACGSLRGMDLDIHDDACICVVMSAGGYPGNYKKGIAITGIETAEKKVTGLVVFHAGTALNDGQLVTAGGRVLNVVALGATIPDAIQRVYKGVDLIHFEGAHFRHDIAQRALKRS